jgi:uncharacterized protein (DUF885 family)
VNIPRTVVALAVVATACASTGVAPSSSTSPSSGTSSTTTVATTTIVPDATTTSTTPGDPGPFDGLSFAEFLEESYRLLLIRSPQGLTSLGIAGEYGMRNDRLNDMSPEYLAERQELDITILEALHGYDRAALAPDEQVSYDVYEWWLNHRVEGHRFAYHDYPVDYFVTSYNANLIRFLTDEHPLDTVEDAEDYISRLSQIDDQVAQVLERLGISEAAGVMPPEIIVGFTITELRRDLGGTTAPTRIDRLPLYTAFIDRFAADVDDATRQSLEQRVEAEVAGSFVPAWVSLIEHLEEIRPLASADVGVWRLPDGDAYYRWLLRGHTSTDLTPEEIHQLGLDNVARVQGELRAAFDALGYPAGSSIASLIERASLEAGSIGGPNFGGDVAALAKYEELVAEAEAAVRDSFGLWPEAPVRIILEEPSNSGFYVPASVDGTRPGSFHAAASSSVALATMPTITFHETVPGHHLQIAIAQELDLPLFRRFTTYNAFVEGWGLYAERLSAELGLYEDDPRGDVGRLTFELLRAVRLVVDTGLHSMGWSRQEARAYMESTIGGWVNQVDRYIVMPGQATGYMIGMQTILDLRDHLMSQGMTLVEFHDAILGGGSMPLEVLVESLGG